MKKWKVKLMYNIIIKADTSMEAEIIAEERLLGDVDIKEIREVNDQLELKDADSKKHE